MILLRSISLHAARRFLLASVWVVASCAREAPREVPRGGLFGHNLLVVTIDTLRPDRLGSYGSSVARTPTLDRLAEEGVRFEHALSHVPVTLPSHSSLFTAKYPTRHGVHDNGTFRLGAEHTTLASRLVSSGYRTAAFVGAFVLDARFGLDQGFEHYDDFYGEKRSFESFLELERRANAVASAAEAWLFELRENGAGNTPWFVWTHFFDPHAPYDAPEPFASRQPEDPYGAEVAFVDHVLQAFLARLDQAGLLDRTLIVVASDHGESLGEHGERTHGTFAYDSTLHVPLILWARGLPPTVFGPRVRLVDVAPTILDLLGVEGLEDTDGASLRPFLYDENDYDPPDSYFEALNPHLTRDWAPLRGIVSGPDKLIDLPIAELYDLSEDPHEARNLADVRRETVSTLSESLAAVVSPAAPLEPSADAATLGRLASLGYVVAPTERGRKSTYTRADDPKRLIELANQHELAGELFQNGRREEAISLLREVLERQPRSSFAYQKLAYALRQMGRTVQAVSVLESAIQNEVMERSLLALLGAYLLELDRVGDARALLERVTAEDPDFAEGHNYLGVALARLGEVEAARASFERLLELDPSSATARNNLGSLALSTGDPVTAAMHLEAALAVDPGLASAANGLGVIHATRGEMDEAVGFWRRAVDVNPQHFDALYNLGRALAENEPGAARTYLERFVREAPKARYAEDVQNARSLLATVR